MASIALAGFAGPSVLVAFLTFGSTPALADGGSGGDGSNINGGAGGAGGGDQQDGQNGGEGKTISTTSGPGGGGGGGGGSGGGIGGTGGNSYNNATAGGGPGQNGASPAGSNDGGGGGGGGNGGAFGQTVTSTATISSPVAGGAGGAGGHGGDGDNNANDGGGGGGGGAGGHGVVVNAAVSVTNNSTISGGAGGAGGRGGNGDGSFTIMMLSYDAYNGSGGSGGAGGVGVLFNAAGSLTNTGSISGGNGGAAGVAGSTPLGQGTNGANGAGGAGVAGAGISIVNSGSIAGGLAGDGVTRADAIQFTGGINTLQLQAGSTITGNVVANSLADTLALGGSASASFDVSQIGPSAQYQFFGIYVKTGISTWTLLGTTTAATPWIINQGILAVSADNNLGASSGGLTFGGGTLQFLSGFTTNRSITLNAGGGTFDTYGNNATLTGGIGGSGGLTVQNSGVGGALTLTNANNTYRGATIINAGATLALSGTGSIASSSGVAANGTFDISALTAGTSITNLSGSGTVTLGANTLTLSNASGVFSGGIGGSGGLTLAAGSETLSGINSYTGATTINGTLDVTGSITASSSVIVNPGGTLTGNGTVDPTTVTIASGAAFAPGTAAVPGTSMTIAGNLAFQSGALYVVYLSPVTSSFANVTGTASLAGSVSANFANGSYISKIYTILSAGSVSGTFSGLTTTNLPPNFTASLSYDSAHAYIDMTLNFTTPTSSTSPTYAPLNVNQSNVASTLINYFNTTGGIPVQFGTLTRAGLTALDGEDATGAERDALELMSQFLDLMLDPFVYGRGSMSGGGQPISFAPEDQASLPPEVARAYDDVLKAQPKPQSFDQRWTAWGAGFGGSNIANGDAAVGSTNITANTYGYAAGMDYHFTPDTAAGFALAGGGTNWGLAQGLGSGLAMRSRLAFTVPAVRARLIWRRRWRSPTTGSRPIALRLRVIR